MLYIFDLDDTLIHEGFNFHETKLCNDTIEVLEYLKTNGYKIVLASHNSHANEYLKATKIDKYFDFAYGEYLDKSIMLINIMMKFPNIEPKNIYFYDDVQENISKARVLGINAYLVDWKVGIKKTQIIS
jgi:HAD superfamily phosphatase (TIGR01681 family)